MSGNLGRNRYGRARPSAHHPAAPKAPVWAGLCAALALAGCDAVSAPEPLGAPRALTVGDAALVIDAPTAAAVKPGPKRGAALDFRPGGRTVKRIELAPARLKDGLARYDERIELRGGGRLAYRLTPHEGPIGSGGPEVGLDGVLLGPGRPLRVSCRLQGEQVGLDDAAWCLAYLRTLRPAQR